MSSTAELTDRFKNLQMQVNSVKDAFAKEQAQLDLLKETTKGLIEDLKASGHSISTVNEAIEKRDALVESLTTALDSLDRVLSEMKL